jgi:hypothetical protein
MPISSVAKRPFAGRHLAAEYDGNLAILWSFVSDKAIDGDPAGTEASD